MRTSRSGVTPIRRHTPLPRSIDQRVDSCVQPRHLPMPTTPGGSSQLPRHRPRAVLSGRHHRLRARCRSTTPKRSAASARCMQRVPRVRARDQPGLRHLGRHIRRKSGEQFAASGRHAERAAVRQLTASSITVRLFLAERYEQVDDRAPLPARRARARRPARSASVSGRISIRAVELGRDERAHDRQAEPGRLLEVEAGSTPRPSSMTRSRS